LLLGEAFVGTGPEAAHVNAVLGPRDGPVGQAWAAALASPSAGHAPFVVVAVPGVPVQPFTLLVNKARIETDRHARMTWGPAQAGVAAGVLAAVREGAVERTDDVLIAAVWVDPAAEDADVVFANNRAATLDALRAARHGVPLDRQRSLADHEVGNPFYPPRSP
jgi:5,6,7,8-tetrahydromethanopterin hydro-lyase